MDPDEEIVEKRKKGKEFRCKASEQDLRRPPFYLKDGDIIAYRLDSENSEKTDDFQTEEDKIKKEEFFAIKSLRDMEDQNDGDGKKKKSNKKKEVGVVINLNDDEVEQMNDYSDIVIEKQD